MICNKQPRKSPGKSRFFEVRTRSNTAALQNRREQFFCFFYITTKGTLNEPLSLSEGPAVLEILARKELKCTLAPAIFKWTVRVQPFHYKSKANGVEAE